MKNFCLDLREHVTKIMNYEKKELISFTKKRRKCIISKKFAIRVKKELVLMMEKKKNFKVHDICNLRYKILKENPVVFHNGSTYDYHFIIKELTEEFGGEFECLGENTEKYLFQ